MWSEKGVDNSRSFLNMPWAQLTHNQTGNELEVFGQHLLLVHSTASRQPSFWAHNTHTPVGAQRNFTFFLSPQHPHFVLHVLPGHTTPTHTSLCCGLRFVYNGLQSFDITRWVSCSYKSIMVWLWRAKIYSFPIIILCHGSTRLVNHWCAPSECLILKAAVWIADLSLIKILFNSFWLQIKLGFWTISEMPPPHNCRFIACIYVKQCSQCLQL